MEKKVSFNSGGYKLAGVIHLPRQNKPPAIVMVHGFRIDKDENYGHFALAAKKFQEAGFLVLRFDQRASGESQGKYEDTTIGTRVEDTLAAVDFVKKQKIDAARLGILGKSLGGEVAVLASLKVNPKALVLWAPVTNSQKFGGIKTSTFTREQVEELKSKGFVTTQSRATGKYYKVGRQFYETAIKIKVEHRLKDLKCPTAIIHGDNDDSVPLGHSKRAYKNVKCVKSLKVIPGMDHSFQGHIDEAIEYSVSWFKRYL